MSKRFALSRTVPAVTGRGRSCGLICAPLTAMLVALAAGEAQATLTVSKKQTQNVSCSTGVCEATAADAVLNATDLVNMLGRGDVRLVPGSFAIDIDVAAPLSWTNTALLTLDSYHSIFIYRPIVVAGSGSLSLTTNDGGKQGHYEFTEKAGSIFGI